MMIKRLALLLVLLCLLTVATQSVFAADHEEWPDDFSTWPPAASQLCASARTKADAFWSRLRSSSWIAVGKPDAPRIVYAFGDPNCIFCHKFWRSSQPWIRAGRVQLRYIPVDILGASSTAKAAAIIMSSNPVSALHRHESAFSSGGIAPATTVADAARKQLEHNRELLQQLGFSSVPAIVTRGGQGAQCWPGLPAPADLQYIMGSLDDG